MNRRVLVRNIEFDIVRYRFLLSLPIASILLALLPSSPAEGAGLRPAHVERTSAWISRNRRLARACERYMRTAAAFVRLAMIRTLDQANLWPLNLNFLDRL